MLSECLYKLLENDLKSSYQIQSTFLKDLFNNFPQVKASDNYEFLQNLLDMVQNLEFPFILLISSEEIMNKFLSIYYDDDFSKFIDMIINQSIKKFDFENKSSSSIENILNFAEIVGINTDYEQRINNLSNLEKSYYEYCNLMTDCQFLKSYLEENPTEIEIDDIIIRIKKMVNEQLNFIGINYPGYIIDFSQGLSKMLTEYEVFFSGKSKNNQENNNNNISNINNYNQIVDINQIYSTPEGKLDPKLRTSFYLNERIHLDEGMNIEYKNYRFPFADYLVELLKKQICGFLNSQGGRVYLGISDDLIVKGIFLKRKDRDLLRNEIANYTTDFYPKCRTNKIEVVFIPVKNKKDESYISNVWVTKIIIKQGEVDKLYSISSRGINAFMRMPGQCVVLSAEEITEEIFKRKISPRNQIDDREYIDVQPEMPVEKEDNHISMDVYLNKFKNNKRLEINLEHFVTLNVKGIPQSADRNSVINIFKDCNYVSEKVFVDKNGYCKGWAFINFKSLNDAEKALQKTKGSKIKGSLLLIKLKEK